MEIWNSKKPTAPGIFSILWGAFVLACPKKQLAKFSFPPLLDEYAFVSLLKKADHEDSMAIAVYQKGGRRFVAKSWHGPKKDLSYYFLVHEFLVTQTLNRLAKRATHDTVSVPEAVDCFSSSTSFIALFEFIEGTTMNMLTPSKQLELWEQAQGALASMGQQLTKAEQKLIGRRGPIFYLILALLFSCLLVLRRPPEYMLALQSFWRLLRLMPNLMTQPLVLAHRDLTSNNLLLGTDGKVYILDFESLVFTIPGYDRAYLSVDPDSTTVSALLKSSDTSLFLQYYILLHHILGSGEYLQVNERYLETLRKLVTQKSL